MKIRVLGSAGAELPGFNPPAFLLNDTILIDAGTTGTVLTVGEQELIRHVVLTHAHLDHVRGLPTLADNIVVAERRQTIQVWAIPSVIAILRDHLMNGLLWPDFTSIPDRSTPALAYREITPGSPVLIDGFTVHAIPVHHTVPAVGYIFRSEGASVLYSGDTGPTDQLWQAATDLSAMIIEVSFPNDMAEMALTTGHLTSSLLARELDKLPALPERIFITHPKPQYIDRITAELAALGIPGITLLRDGVELTL